MPRSVHSLMLATQLFVCRPRRRSPPLKCYDFANNKNKKNKKEREKDSYLFTPSQLRWVIRTKKKCIGNTCKILIHCFGHKHVTVNGRRSLGEMKLDELGRQKFGRQQAKRVKRYSDPLQDSKEGTFDNPRLPPGGTIISASAVSHR